jgi:hypothetical protein
MPERGAKHYYLTHCYFHFFFVPKRDDTDYIFGLHAEPEEKLHDHIDQCKAGPHMHVHVKEERLRPLSDGHFPLFLSVVKEVVASKKSFDQAMRTAMTVVEKEVLNRFVTA